MNRPDSRILALDLVRGVAVLGILAINIGGFAGPIAATLSPHQPLPGTAADEAWYAFALVVFEGKMRAVFTMLFGASMLLFVDRAEEAGQDGERLQLRRLGWLALFGYLHFLLLWWGDILFLYALAGAVALAFRNAPPRPLLVGALGLFLAWHAALGAQGLSVVADEQSVLSGTAPPARVRSYQSERAMEAAATATELARYREGWFDQIAAKAMDQSDEPLNAALATIGETVPLMLIGMALYRLGFFHGSWSARALRRLMVGGIAAGGAVTIAFAAYAWSRHFPPVLMVQALAYGLAGPHLLMGLGYTAGLMLAAPYLVGTELGRRVIAAGRMAFTNYIAMTVVMTFVFYGWGLGLVGEVAPRWHPLFVAGGWLLMLGWSPAVLARFRQGPLEWLWRSLTQWRLLPLLRPRPTPAQVLA